MLMYFVSDHYSGQLCDPCKEQVDRLSNMSTVQKKKPPFYRRFHRFEP